jgi:hypothetical protein
MDTKTDYTTSHIEDGQAGFHSSPATVVKIQDSRFGAYLAREKPSPFSKSLLKLYPILFVAFMNSAANGFDGNTFGMSPVPVTFQYQNADDVQ